QIQCNVNVGTFIPKPHTPYQWIRQLSPEESVIKMNYIRENLPRGKFKVGTHNENVAFLEGLVSRCDRRAGEVILEAYKRGVRLDAWEEHLRENMPIWLDVFSKANWNVRNEILRERSLDEELPWKSVTLGPSASFYKKEWNKSLTHLLTSKCSTTCTERCGVCNKEKAVHSVKNDVEKLLENPSAPVNKVNASRLENVPILWRCLFTFEKKDGSEYISHLSQLEIFQRAFLCASLPILYTNGFNPIPRLEFASTLSIGIRSYDEIASCVLTSKMTEDDFVKKMNACLPSNLRIKSCYIFEVTNQRKRESLATSLWGNRYDYSLKSGYDMNAFLASDAAKEITSKEGFICNKKDSSWDFTIPFKYDRPFRNALEDFFGKKIYEFCYITKTCTLASPVITGWTAEDDKAWLASHSKADMSDVICDEVSKETKDNAPVPYYELYERIAQINQSLIQERRAIAIKRREFFKTHPEMANRNKAQKSQAKKED
ncbi:MAG: TIGR03936 family radical SAM-associated protein, partial [Treponema sp.]|nr:TIGR03936 family radical SAM-associated protein [Treponema sp.]